MKLAVFIEVHVGVARLDHRGVETLSAAVDEPEIPPERVYAIVEGVIGVVALVFHKTFVGMTDAFYFSIMPEIGSSVLGGALKWTAASALILPQSVLLGMTFPLLSMGLLRRYPSEPGASLAMLYFTNSIGAAICSSRNFIKGQGRLITNSPKSSAARESALLKVWAKASPTFR